MGSGLGLAASSGLARGCAVAPGDDVATAGELEQALRKAMLATAAISLSLSLDTFMASIVKTPERAVSLHPVSENQRPPLPSSLSTAEAISSRDRS